MGNGRRARGIAAWQWNRHRQRPDVPARTRSTSPATPLRPIEAIGNRRCVRWRGERASEAFPNDRRSEGCVTRSHGLVNNLFFQYKFQN